MFHQRAAVLSNPLRGPEIQLDLDGFTRLQSSLTNSTAFRHPSSLLSFRRCGRGGPCLSLLNWASFLLPSECPQRSTGLFLHGTAEGKGNVWETQVITNITIVASPFLLPLHWLVCLAPLGLRTFTRDLLAQDYCTAARAGGMSTHHRIDFEAVRALQSVLRSDSG